MEKLKVLKKIIRQNYLQLFFVFAAFALMVVASYYFMSSILRARLFREAKETLLTADANIKTGFAEAEAALLNSYYVVSDMLDAGEPESAVLDYLKRTTARMRQASNGRMAFFGIYGCIDGHFLDGVDFNPPPDYDITSRPWYLAAFQAGEGFAYTPPYAEWKTGDTRISVVKKFSDKEGNLRGVLSIDLGLRWLQSYADSMALAQGGYGMIVDRKMIVITHPDYEYIGIPMEEMGDAYREIAGTLRAHGSISAKIIKDPDQTQEIVFFRQIGNGWYVGLVTPSRAFYDDMYHAAVTLSFFGFFLMIALFSILISINAAKIKADEDSKSKSSFLANMSHEIRTPMNAILGMTELLLRKDIPLDAYEEALEIKQAGANLLAIINDILDFSKIESGKLSIIPAEYLFTSLINDCISIIKMRIGEKPIRFVTNIDSSLPNVLFGDGARVRQILLNLLSNAVKYTLKGQVVFSVEAGARNNIGLSMNFKISDTGIGIKEENIAKLFGDFVQFDNEKNRGIEGTGLGLAISRNLCKLMGGDITVQSTYGAGSTFTAVIPQKVRDPAPFASIENPETKRVVILERRNLWADSIIYSVEKLGGVCTQVRTPEELRTLLQREEYQFLFAGKFFMEAAMEVLAELDKKMTIVLLIEAEEAAPSDSRCIAMPTYPAPIANVLNGIIETKEHERKWEYLHFIAPDANILVIDDMVANLKVAKGLMTLYQMQIDTCTGGAEAVNLVRKKDYDVVFIDHMMPGMDGIETAAAIRGLGQAYKELPLVCLTANAIIGMKEMFLSKGFNDYLAKPIDITKLNTVLEKWVPLSKRREKKAADEESGADSQSADGQSSGGSSSAKKLAGISGMDVTEALSHVGSEETLVEVLGQFCADFDDYVGGLENAFVNRDWKDYSIRIHAIKGFLATVGIKNMSNRAKTLETAAKNGDTGTCEADTNPLCASLRDFREALLGTGLFNKEPEAETRPVDKAFLAEKLDALYTACFTSNSNEADDLVEELKAVALETSDTGNGAAEAWAKCFARVREMVESYDYIPAAEEIKLFLADIL